MLLGVPRRRAGPLPGAVLLLDCFGQGKLSATGHSGASSAHAYLQEHVVGRGGGSTWQNQSSFVKGESAALRC